MNKMSWLYKHRRQQYRAREGSALALYFEKVGVRHPLTDKTTPNGSIRFLRLTQCVWWGHPVTPSTGAIDYFLSLDVRRGPKGLPGTDGPDGLFSTRRSLSRYTYAPPLNV